MSTMVDNRWDSRFQNQQGPITSGFISNSDIKQREKQDRIKWERQREYEDIMNKNPVYYKTGGGSQLSLPLGQYEESRRVLDDQRQRDYNQYMSKKREEETRKREEFYRNTHENYKPPPEPDMIDHHQITEDLRRERKNEYNDFLKKKQYEEQTRIRHRHQYTPPGGLPIGQYDQQRKKLQEELRSEYKESLLKQRQDQLLLRAKEFHLDTAPEYLGNLNEERPLVGSPSPRNLNEVPRYQREMDELQSSRRHAPPTPPGGLNIATEQERKHVEDLKKSLYRDELLKQQKEQLYNRAQQQGEIPILNRQSPTQGPTSPQPRGRPPPHPDSGRRRGPPQQDPRMDNRMNQDDIRTGFFDDRRRTPPNRDERQHDYQNYLAEQQRKEAMKQQKIDEMRQAPQSGVPKGDYYNSDTYEQKKQTLNSQRREEYQDFLSKQPQAPSSGKGTAPLTGLPLYQEKYDEHYNTLKQRRNEEYNQLLEEKKPLSQREHTPANLQGLPINQQRYDQAKRQQEMQRNKEYNEHLAKQIPDQTKREWNDRSDPKGIMGGIDSYDYDKRKQFADERKQEYKDIMEKKYGHQPPRKAPEPAPANGIGFMAHLGFHEKEREKLNREKRDAYNKYLDEKAYGKEGMPRGRPNWVDGKDSWYNQEPPPFNKSPGPGKDQGPPRDRPGSFTRRPSPSYQEILDSKRRQEASYRRFDDQEYSRAGPDYGRSPAGPGPEYSRPPVGLGPDYSRPPVGPNDGYMGRYD